MNTVAVDRPLWQFPVLLRIRTCACRLLVLFTLCACPVSASSSYILEEFSDFTHMGEFNNLVIHQSTGKIYIGAVNRLYLLSETLGLHEQENTGPQDDYINCLPPFDNCHCTGTTDCEKPVSTSAVNKALLIDYDSKELITCSNLFQGHCEKRSLTMLSVEEPHRYVPMVPNDDRSPVVIFIAPGPGMDTPTHPRPNVLYIGATRSLTESIYKDMVHTVCSRNISTYELVKADSFTATRVEMDVLQKQTFRIYYKYGFSSSGFSYFLTVQGESVTNTDVYVTRIVRICQNDTRFYSYTEVPLKCIHNNTEYNTVKAAYLGYAGKTLATSLGLPDLPDLRTSEDVLYTIFTNDNPENAETGQAGIGGSVMCVYSIRDIRRVFTTNIQECFDGIGNTGPAHLTRPDPCIPWQDTENILDDDYCGRYEFNHPIAGLQAVEANAVLQFPNDSITAIAVTETHDYTVAFLGTDNGQLKKVAVESGESAFEYESISIQDNSPVNTDMAFDRSRSHIYVMTQKKVTRVKVQDCNRYVNCSSCLTAKDPFCGWCSLDNRCTLRKDCENAEDTMRWLPYTGTQCTKIMQVIPEKVQIQDNSTLLMVTVQNLPTLTNGQYQCAFRMGNGTPRFTRAELLGNPTKDSTNRTLQCETPMKNRLPMITTGKGNENNPANTDFPHQASSTPDHMVMTLSIRMDNRDFVEKFITFFNCGAHTSCSSCTDSDFPCAWCVQAHTCTYDREKCLTDTIITGKSLPGPTDTPGPEFCPRIEHDDTQILVPSNILFNVKVTALNLQDFQEHFYCRFSMHGTKEVGAVRTRNDQLDNIECNDVQFQYDGMSSKTRAVPFQILWGRDKHALDNPDAIQVMMYKCGAMASNCGECLTTESKFKCGWCSDRCTTINECPATVEWLDRDRDCPDPVINKFFPIRGPTEGGTLVTIIGQNLGKRFEDTESGITVAGVECESLKDFYQPATQIVCRTSTSDNGDESTGPIEIYIKNLIGAKSQGLFSYVEPYLMNLLPDKGPVSGGTRITITGEYMDAGTQISVMVGSRRCNNQELHPGMILCTTPSLSVDSTPDSRLVVQFDDAVIYGDTFLYIEDPMISDVQPEKGIFNGGTSLEVTGDRLDIIQRPQIVVYYQDRSFIEDCQNVSQAKMRCVTPTFQSSDLLNSDLDFEEPLMLSYGFIMDEVHSLRNLTELTLGQRLFGLYPNPEFDPFDEGIRSVFQIKKHDDLLTITGKDLNLALTEGDVRVMIGETPCAVTSLSSTVLTCKPPNFDESGISDRPDVYVYIGENLEFYIGQLQVETHDTILTFPIIIGIAAGAGLLILVIVIIVTMYMRKSQESDRAVKRMQNQMDVLEIRVAKECKEAFAELQTDMTELTGDICGPSGIPFRDYRKFCMKVLFPNTPEDEHPVTRFNNQEFLPLNNSNIERGLHQFNMLIQHKLFLLIFIRTMEQDPGFTAKEKVNVASLISCALQNRMEYHTEILKTLLAELIEKSMDSRDHPKLLLRRTNSVAEKMLTNWFTFLLYRFLKECVGEPLYVLFRAMKQQVDKGPVDAITSEARYSLSEDKLIRQQVEYKNMTIYIMDTAYPAHEYPVRVLDCDTISQVKEKALDAMYKNAAFSTRPDKDDLELEWRTGEKGRVLLHDEDSSTKQEGEFRKINTLSHYHVLENSRLQLVHKQTSMYNLSNVSDRSHHNNFNVTYSGSPSLSRSVSPHNIAVSEMENGGTKHYHLVKHDSDLHKEGERGSKMVSEIYLTRLLATKGTLQQFVDDLLETIFSTATRRCALPLAIKYMFDFLDDQALQHCITDPEIVHTWKSNSLPLRFWINVVKNPDFVFDMHKSNIVDACLSVVAQTFMDSCSMSEHKLSKDSPSSKLLYAKDIPKYKKWVERYYQDIKQMPAISDQDMNTMLAEESRLHQDKFNLNPALYELFQYVVKYQEDLIYNLQEDEFARNYHLVDRLVRVIELIESEA